MRLGFRLRRIWIITEDFFRSLLNFIYYFIWLIFDFSKFKKINKEQINSILVVYGGATGDFYNILGILNELNHKYPKIKIYLYTKEENKKFVKNTNINLINLGNLKQYVRERKIDCLFFLESYFFPNGKYPLLLKIPYRISTDQIGFGSLKGNLYLISNKRIFPRFENGIKRYLKAFKKLGFEIDKLRFFFIKSSEEKALEFISKNRLKDKKLIFFHPGGGKIVRCLKENKVPSPKWPSERWARLADKLLENKKNIIIFTGTKDEKPIIKEIKSLIKHNKQIIDTSGTLILEDIASLFKYGNLLVSIDTSIAHIGGQVGIPLIDLIGSYHPELGQPITEKKIMLFPKKGCRFCRKYSCTEENNICMKNINVKDVYKNSKKILSKV